MSLEYYIYILYIKQETDYFCVCLSRWVHLWLCSAVNKLKHIPTQTSIKKTCVWFCGALRNPHTPDDGIDAWWAAEHVSHAYFNAMLFLPIIKARREELERVTQLVKLPKSMSDKNTNHWFYLFQLRFKHKTHLLPHQVALIAVAGNNVNEILSI